MALALAVSAFLVLFGLNQLPRAAPRHPGQVALEDLDPADLLPEPLPPEPTGGTP